jgi:hypothetical protein
MGFGVLWDLWLEPEAVAMDVEVHGLVENPQDSSGLIAVEELVSLALNPVGDLGRHLDLHAPNRPPVRRPRLGFKFTKPASRALDREPDTSSA